MTDFPGARWWKFDFHAHTPASRDFLPGVPEEERAQVTPECWLLRYMAAGIDCVAVTDHNTGDWIDKLKESNKKLAAERPPGYRPIHIFPGVEISANAGVHLLAIFDPSATSRKVDDVLAAVQYDGTRGDSDGVTRCSLVQVVEKVHEHGGLLIPAHADQEKGLLCLRPTSSGDAGPKQAALDAGTLRQILHLPFILAMEVVDATLPMPALYDEVAPRWTMVLGSDSHNFRNGPVPGSRFTWVKMGSPSLEGPGSPSVEGPGSPSLEGLRLALVDGNDFSVQRVEAPDAGNRNQPPRDWIESVHIENARYMGRGSAVDLRFSPWMTALVGGRGTGKSTVLHFLRGILDRRDELERLPGDSEPRKALERFWKVHKTRRDEGGLEDNTKVGVVVAHGGSRFRIVLRDMSSRTVSELLPDGREQAAGSQEVRKRFRVRIFSQGQVLALADEGVEALLALIDEAADTEAVTDALADEERRFLTLRAQLRELDQKLGARDRVTAQLEDVQRQLAAFETHQHASVLTAHQRRSRQIREIEKQVRSATALVGEMEDIAARMVLPDLPEGLFTPGDPVDQAAQAALTALAAAVTGAAGDLGTIAGRLRSSSDRFREEALGAGGLEAVASAARTAYDSVVAALEAAGVTEPDAYGRLVQDRQRLEQEIAHLESLYAQRQAIEREADTSRQKVFEQRHALQDRRRQFLQQNLADNPFVRIRLQPGGDNPEAADQSLREILGILNDQFKADLFNDASGTASGHIAKLYEDLEASDFERRRTALDTRIDGLRTAMLEAATGQQPAALGGRFVNFLARTQKKQPEVIDRMLLWAPPDGLSVEYSPGGDGRDYRPIQQGSPGQRAAAMLAFLLAHGEEPIVLDQPEDDLDNHLIYDLIVQQIRESKRKRQVIVVTHNANVVVNGDAEMTHALEFGGGQCYVKVQGAMQDSDLREEICRVMEGGHEAFRRRYRRLGDGGHDVR